MSQYNYCPRCRKRTPHVQDVDEKKCLRCGHRERRQNLMNFRL